MESVSVSNEESLSILSFRGRLSDAFQWGHSTRTSVCRSTDIGIHRLKADFPGLEINISLVLTPFKL